MLPATRRDTDLSASEIRDYFETGWIVRRALFAADEVARMRSCFDELEHIASSLTETGPREGSYFVLGQKNGGQVIDRVVWAGGCQPYLLEIGDDPRLTAVCARLLGSDSMDHLLNQAHFKRPGDGVSFGWHQDIEHRDKGDGSWTDVNGSGSFVQTVIALDEMTPDSGPILFVPGSSKWGRVAFDGQASWAKTAGAAPRSWGHDAVAVSAQAGDTLFFGPYTAHASFENRSSRYRRVLINGYAAPGANRREYPGAGVGRPVMAAGNGAAVLGLPARRERTGRRVQHGSSQVGGTEYGSPAAPRE